MGWLAGTAQATLASARRVLLDEVQNERRRARAPVLVQMVIELVGAVLNTEEVHIMRQQPHSRILVGAATEHLARRVGLGLGVQGLVDGLVGRDGAGRHLESLTWKEGGAKQRCNLDWYVDTSHLSGQRFQFFPGPRTTLKIVLICFAHLA
jgi:hypothetical protein